MSKLINGRFSFVIEKGIEKKDIIEYCLNLVASGYNPVVIFSLYGMYDKMTIDEFIYYIDMFKQVQRGYQNVR
jgi:hypothetical protein